MGNNTSTFRSDPDAQPLVSVLVRSMNRPTLSRALDSAAAQTWPRLEIVVAAACGMAHPPLPATHQGRPLRLIHSDADGPLDRPAAANLCLEAANGEWLIFLDDDDEFLPLHLATLIEASRVRDRRLIYSYAQLLNDEGIRVGTGGKPGLRFQLYHHTCSVPCATLIHRSLIEEGARFDPEFLVCEDYDFYVNCASRTEFQFVDADYCIWHAYAGESGCGFGSNKNDELHDQYIAKLKRKWKPLFDSWLADPNAMLYFGQQCLMNEQFQDATRILETVVRQKPDDVNALNLCGMANLKTGNAQRAHTLLLKASQKLPAHPGIRANLDLAIDVLKRRDVRSST